MDGQKQREEKNSKERKMLGHHWAVPEHGEDAEEKILVSMSDVSMEINCMSLLLYSFFTVLYVRTVCGCG